jgi:hypothetical protein
MNTLSYGKDSSAESLSNIKNKALAGPELLS